MATDRTGAGDAIDRRGMPFDGYDVAGAHRAQHAALASRLGIPFVFAADVLQC